VFILIGCIGGVLGALWIKLNVAMIRVRARHVLANRPMRRLYEVGLLSWGCVLHIVQQNLHANCYWMLHTLHCLRSVEIVVAAVCRMSSAAATDPISCWLAASI
jgi:hypothetical protein